MNKQELIEKYKEYENGLFNIGARVVCQLFLQDLEQLDEPQKVKVPQFVAEYIEESRLKGWDLLASMCFVVSAKKQKTTKWFYLGENKNIFALAWIFGYEVEKENQYVVTLKNGQPLVKSQSGSTLYFSQNITAGNYKVTRKELEEADFGWVFDCEGIEIEEVE